MLVLPATPAELVREVIEPALVILPVGMDSPVARVMLTAIAAQESGIAHRVQITPDGRPAGPARGLWQFERGGVAGVLGHDASRDLAAMCCQEAGVPANPAAVHRALASHDELACQFARLLLWTDPEPLPRPVPESEEQAWRYYLRLWRPGKPHRDRWVRSWRRGLEALRA